MALKKKASAKAEPKTEEFEYDSCRVYQTDDSYLVSVSDSANPGLKTYINLKSITEKLQLLVDQGSVDTLLGEVILKADTFSITFEEELPTVTVKGKQYLSWDPRDIAITAVDVD